MRQPTSLWLACLFASAAGEASASQLVFGLDHNVAGSGAPMSGAQGLQFMLEFHPPNDPGVLQRLGGGVYWQDGASGSYDFGPDNSPEFSQFSALITNGLDDEIILLTHDSQGTGGGDLWPESMWGFGVPDLAGNQIDFIRLVVHDLTIEPYDPGPPFGEGLEWNGHITWEFWGSPVPEPASASLLLLTATLLLRRGRASRHLTGDD